MESKMEVEFLSPKEKKAPIAQQRRTSKYMTKYEMARIIGIRASQISMGAPAYVELTNETDPIDIARTELLKKRIPIIVRRYFPDQTYEDWTVEELIIELQ